MARKSRKIKKTILRYKGKNCDGTKRAKLEGMDRAKMKRNLEYGRYVMACNTVGIPYLDKEEFLRQFYIE